MDVTMTGKRQGDVDLKPEISKTVDQGPNPAIALGFFFVCVLLMYVWGQVCVYVPV